MNPVTSTLPALHRMPPISLPEITLAADLQTRVDRKYLVPSQVAAAIVTDLAPTGACRVLEIDGLREMRYASVYFDTDELASYLASARRRRRRFKVRTRSYCDSGDCFLEVKTRGGRDTTVKQRTPYPARAAGTITADGADHIRGALGRAGIDPTAIQALRATLRVRYRRCTLYLPSGRARVTVDTGLTWHADGAGVGVADLAIVETKSGRDASTVDRTLWTNGHRPVRISKYGTGMAVLHQDLPANKWHRTLTGPLRPALYRLDPAATDQGESS